jgi:cell division septation protein DedD
MAVGAIVTALLFRPRAERAKDAVAAHPVPEAIG